MTTYEKALEELIISKEMLRQAFGKGTKITPKQFNKWNKQHVIHNTWYTLVRYNVIQMSKNMFGDYEYHIA